MKNLIILAGILFGNLLFVSAQSGVDEVLAQVEKNNLTLHALKQNLEATMIGNKTGLLPDNPEAGYGFLWGNPSPIGNRQDVYVTQSFDFPSAYLYRSQIAGIRNDQAETEYHQNRKEIIYQARLLCIDQIYYNALHAEFSGRLNHAEIISSAYDLKYKTGESGLLDYNKARLNFQDARQELSRINLERNALLNELKIMNGGNPVVLNDSLFPPASIPEDFDTWFNQMEPSLPGLKWLEQETDASRKEEKLAFSLALPGFSTGYMSEKVVGEQFQGVTAGITIPLWADKNRMKYAKAKSLTAENHTAAARLEVRQSLQLTWNKAVELQKILGEYRKNVRQYNNSELLMKALNAGEISLIEYILELSVWYQSREKLLEMDRNLQKVVAELHKYE